MNVVDILKYGHLTLLGSVEGLSETESQVGGVCGWWSVKDYLTQTVPLHYHLTCPQF